MSREASWKSAEPAACNDADQLEFASLRGTFATIDSAILDNTISGEIDDEMNEVDVDGPHWQLQDLAEEGLLDTTRSEIQRRIRLMGSGYPFTFTNNKLQYNPSSSGLYEFCLSITRAPSITSGDFVQFPRLFERATAYLLRHYFGADSRALHTGAPRHPSTKFRDVMKRLERSPFEWVWNPQLEMEDGDVKDETLDFVITLPPLDWRSGSLHVLGQCACGNNWNTKLKDPDLNKLKKWFHPGWAINPVRAFTTPFIIGDSTMRDVVSESDALVFDRARLVNIVERRVGDSGRRRMKRRVAPVTALLLD